MEKLPVYQEIAKKQDARLTCIKRDNYNWIDSHRETIEDIIIEDIIEEYLPHGSGLDYPIVFDYDNSMLKKEVLYFYTSYHVMDNNGYYAGIIDFTITIKPSLMFGFHLDIKGNFGKNQDLKDHIYDTFDYAFNEIVK